MTASMMPDVEIHSASIAAALRSTYDIDISAASVSEVLERDWLRSAVYPFSTTARLPHATQSWKPANYRFAAYAQLTRIVYEACDEQGLSIARGERLSWTEAGVVAACVREVSGDA